MFWRTTGGLPRKVPRVGGCRGIGRCCVVSEVLRNGRRPRGAEADCRRKRKRAMGKTGTGSRTCRLVMQGLFLPAGPGSHTHTHTHTLGSRDDGLLGFLKFWFSRFTAFWRWAWPASPVAAWRASGVPPSASHDKCQLLSWLTYYCHFAAASKLLGLPWLR